MWVGCVGVGWVCGWVCVCVGCVWVRCVCGGSPSRPAAPSSESKEPSPSPLSSSATPRERGGPHHDTMQTIGCTRSANDNTGGLASWINSLQVDLNPPPTLCSLMSEDAKGTDGYFQEVKGQCGWKLDCREKMRKTAAAK